jgi:hypothetical protein
MKSISADVARALAGHQGNQLILDGLTDLSVEVAEALAEHKGYYLNGIRKRSATWEQEFANQNPGSLRLGGLTELSVEAATALAAHKGKLFLNGLKRVSSDVAAALWEKGVVELPSRFNRWDH